MGDETSVELPPSQQKHHRVVVVGALALALVGVLVMFVATFQSLFSPVPVPSYSNGSTPPKKIGVAQFWSRLETFHQGLRQGMQELGYLEGRDVVYLYQNIEQDVAKLDEMVKTLVDQNVDVLFVVGSPTVASALTYTKEKGKLTPIVFVIVDKPVEEGFAASLRSSGNNATGVASNMAEVIPKQLDFLKQINPDAKRVGIFGKGFHVPQGPGRFAIDALREHAPEFGLRVVEYTTDAPPGPQNEAEFRRIASTIKRGDVDAIMHIPGHYIANQDELETEVGKRIGAINVMPIAEEVETGGLFSYSADSVDVGRQAAVMVDKILRGVAPSQIPIEYPRRDTLSINMKTAREAGITIPPSVLNVVDKLY